jgi:hypothetical protein
MAKRRRRSVRRKSNPRYVVLYAQAKGSPVLKYLGGIKFARAGRAAHFLSAKDALAVGHQLKRHFATLRKFRLWAA